LATDYTALVRRVAKMLCHSSFDLDPLIGMAATGNISEPYDATRTKALLEWLLQAGLCDHKGRITDSTRFQTFLSHVQGAIWAYVDSEELTPKIQLVLTNPVWLNIAQARQTIDVFRDLIRSATQTLWIINPFFSIDSQQVNNLIDLLALQLQQGNVSVRLVLRKAIPGSRELVFPTLRRLRSLVPDSSLHLLKVYNLDNDGISNRKRFHAKMIIKDNQSAYVGSANWTKNSLESDMELGLLVEGIFVEQQLVPILHKIIDFAEPIQLETL
jgi:phosphatidylserine/phosphatidylglycerophosphate/cardiolipin synthase-like enzyme